MNKVKFSTIGFVFSAGLLGGLTGCIGYVDEPRHASGYSQPAPVYVENNVVVQDDYVYYPAYEVYYSSNRRQYIYLEGSSWVSRPAPPHVSVNVLFASPSVRLDFHDSPAAHHETVVRQYPKHWAPSESNHNDKEGRNDGRSDGHSDEHSEDRKGHDKD